jgi:hypothetical protein
VTSRTTTLRATLVATWISVTGQTVPDALVMQLDDAVMAPGGSSALDLALTAPAAPGDYLLLVDVVTPATGALSSGGVRPAIVRVTVGAAPAIAPTPTPTPDGTPSLSDPSATGGAPTASPTSPTTSPTTVPTTTHPVTNGGQPGSTDTTSGGPKRPD